MPRTKREMNEYKREWQRKWRKKNREEFRIRNKAWCKAYYYRNREAILEKKRKSCGRKIYEKAAIALANGDPRPPSTIVVDGKTKTNPAYTKWYERNYREEINARKRRYYKKNRDKFSARAKKRPQKKYVPTVAEFQKQRIEKQREKRMRLSRPGFVYFFKSVSPGFYKAGCTTNWDNRKLGYSGPASIEKTFFVRPVRDRIYAEVVLKNFLENAGYKPYRTRCCDWFTLGKWGSALKSPN